MKEMKQKPKSTTQMLGGCLTDMLFYINQLHYTHWLTLKNHHHVVVGELYEELEEELDELVESYLGACLPLMKPEEALNSALTSQEPHYFKVIKNEADILALIEEITARAQKGLSLVENDSKFSFMRDTIMDLIAALHSAKYKITQE